MKNKMKQKKKKSIEERMTDLEKNVFWSRLTTTITLMCMMGLLLYTQHTNQDYFEMTFTNFEEAEAIIHDLADAINEDRQNINEVGTTLQQAIEIINGLVLVVGGHAEMSINITELNSTCDFEIDPITNILTHEGPL